MSDARGGPSRSWYYTQGALIAIGSVLLIAWGQYWGFAGLLIAGFCIRSGYRR